MLDVHDVSEIGSNPVFRRLVIILADIVLLVIFYIIGSSQDLIRKCLNARLVR